MTAEKAAFAVSERARGRAHLTQIRVSPDMKLSNQIQIIIQHIIEISALLSGFCQDHGQMQGDRSHVKPAYKDGGILLVSRVHTAPLIPGREERAASHGGNHLAVLFIHAGYIALSGQAKPVRVHGLGGALHPCLKHVLQLLTRSV